MIIFIDIKRKMRERCREINSGIDSDQDLRDGIPAVRLYQLAEQYDDDRSDGIAYDAFKRSEIRHTDRRPENIVRDFLSDQHADQSDALQHDPFLLLIEIRISHYNWRQAKFQYQKRHKDRGIKIMYSVIVFPLDLTR